MLIPSRVYDFCSSLGDGFPNDFTLGQTSQSLNPNYYTGKEVIRMSIERKCSVCELYSHCLTASSYEGGIMSCPGDSEGNLTIST